MKQIYVFLVVLLVILLTSCGSGDSSSEHSPETPELIEQAKNEGREAAREFVNTVWEDTMELQGRLMDVKSRQSRYEINGDTKAAAAYDSAFISTLRSVNSAIYNLLTSQE